MQIEIYTPSMADITQHALFYVEPVCAGFPSPTSGYEASELNLHDYCVKNRNATFFVRASGSSMIEAGISDNDILVVDRSLKPIPGNVVIAAMDNEFTVKLLNVVSGKPVLMPMNRAYSPIYPDPDSLIIWGVVTYIVKKAEICLP